MQYLFPNYRKKYQFSDFEVISYLVLNTIFVIFLVALLGTKGFDFIIKWMFFLFLIPLFIAILFNAKAKFINYKRKKLLQKRMTSDYYNKDSVLLIWDGNNEAISNYFFPVKNVEVPSSEYINPLYEIKVIARKEGCDAIIGVKNNHQFIRGYIARKGTEKDMIIMKSVES